MNNLQPINHHNYSETSSGSTEVITNTTSILFPGEISEKGEIPVDETSYENYVSFNKDEVFPSMKETWKIHRVNTKDEARRHPSAKHAVALSRVSNLLMRDFVYKLNTGEIVIPNITIGSLFVRSISHQFYDYANFTFNSELKVYVNGSDICEARVVYKGCEFILLFATLLEDRHNGYILQDYLYITAFTSEGVTPSEIESFLSTESEKHSGLRGSSLIFNVISDDGESNSFLDSVKPFEPRKILLDELFIPEIKKQEIERFIYSVENYERDGINLRYLLNGPPGTGKTQLMNVIAHRLKGKATIVLGQNFKDHIRELFYFSGLFSPVVLILDDLDLFIGQREVGDRNENLGFFLQQLDGLIPGNLFLICTTNDKKLVDTAASRPGRFDLILDISEMNYENYMDLIKRETNDEMILSLFTPEILDLLRKKKVTGAFIVSFVKQLRSTQKISGELTPEKFMSLLDLIHRGFYSDNSGDKVESFGFNR